MADRAAGLSKEHGVDSRRHFAACCLNSKGCTGKGDTRSRIGPDVVTPAMGRSVNHNDSTKEWKNRDQGRNLSY